MKRLLLVLALVAAGCSAGPDEAAPLAQETAGFIAVSNDDGTISTLDPGSGLLTRVTAASEPGRRFSQPTWSPDGSRLAFVVSSDAVAPPGIQAAGGTVRVAIEAQGIDSAVHIVPAAGGEAVVVTTPFPPFYLYWSPDGTKVAFLGNDIDAGRQGFGIIDVEAGTVDPIDYGQPYYFAWAPDSDRLLVHAANRELYYLELDGTKETVGPTPGSFSAPGWSGSTQTYPVAEGRRQILRLFAPDGTVRRDAIDFGTAIAFVLSPDAERVAYINIDPGSSAFALGSLVVDSPDGATELADQAAAFFWSPDGSKLLFLTPDSDEEGLGLRWNTWDGSETRTYERFLPTLTYIQQYHPFFSQYANSLSFFSPDGRSFTFAGTIDGRGEGVWVQALDEDAPAELVAGGQFSTWGPAPAAGNPGTG